MIRGDLSHDTIVACFAQDGKHCQTALLVFPDLAKMPENLTRACAEARAKYLKETDR